MVRTLESLSVAVRDAVVLEIGTGWSCLGAMTLAQYGTQEICTIDLHHHLRNAYVEDAAEYILANWEKLGIAGLSRGISPRGNAPEILEALGIQYLAPCDLLKMTEESKFDLVFSCAVMEHIPASILPAFVQACHRLVKPKGVVHAIVTPGDHYAWALSDQQNITKLNYLKYSDFIFNLLYNPRISHQNRWRCSQYLDLFHKAGFTLLSLDKDVFPGWENLLPTLRLAPQFQKFASEDLATTQFYATFRKS